MLAIALLELRNLARLFGVWMPGALVAWSLVAWLQEPALFRHSGVNLFWGGVEAATRIALAIVPLAWLLQSNAAARSWQVRAIQRPWRLVLAQAMGIVGYGGALVAVVIMLGITLDRISGRTDTVFAVPESAWRLLLFLAPLATLAPGLATRSWSPLGAALLWLPLCAASLWATGHGGGSTWLAATVSPAFATGAGILTSFSLIVHKTRT